MLRPIPARARRRRIKLVVGMLAATIAAHLGLALALDDGARPIAIVAVVPVAAPVVQVVWTPLVTPIATSVIAPPRASCPAPRADAPWVAPVLPESVTGVRPARTDARWIAAWNADHVFVSRDAGRTFRRELDGPGEVRDVSFDCYGHAIALRAGRVGVRFGASDVWNPVPGLGVYKIEPESDAPSPPDNLLPAAIVGRAARR